MKTFKLFQYFLLVVFTATLMFSCSDDDSDLTATDNIELRNGEDQIAPDQWADVDAECFVKLCVDVIPPEIDINFNDIVVVDVPGIGTWTITEGEVELPDGSKIPLIDNQYCFSVPINAVQNVQVDFHGYGGVNVTGQWSNGAVCPLFDALWPGTFDAPLNEGGEFELTCESPCPPPPECFVEACITFIEGDPSDNYLLELPTVGTVSISNGTVTINTATFQQFPLPADGTFCVNLPIFNPVTALVTYNGTGSVVITGTWPDSTTCTIFSVGECTSDPIHVIQEPVELSCEPPCPAPLCEIEACITFIEGDPSDNYLLQLPTVGNVSIANGIVTLPNGCTFPLPADGTFCTTLPIFAPVTATVIYNGTGSVEINATYENGTECTIFSAGVNSQLNLHVIEDVTLSCEPECPPIPDCYVNVCLDITDPANDIFKVEIPGVGSVQVVGGLVIAPSGTFPLIGNQFCVDIPIFNSGTLAKLTFIGAGEAVVTATYPDLTECVIFSAGVGISGSTILKQDVTLTCEPPCPTIVDICPIDIWIEFDPATLDDIYQVVFAEDAVLTIQGGVITMPNGTVQEYNGQSFAMTVQVPFDATAQANQFFKGFGSVQASIVYADGGNCTVFSAGVGTEQSITAQKPLTLSCVPIC